VNVKPRQLASIATIAQELGAKAVNGALVKLFDGRYPVLLTPGQKYALQMKAVSPLKCCRG
jgi:hypothetical protein